jgi:HD-GYP domain-containing protein (c-di-GMP phosphodiesterase class II)
MKHQKLIYPLISILGPYMIFEALNLGFIQDVSLFKPIGHFYVVSLASFLASLITIAIGIAGSRLRNIKVSFLSLSFLSLGVIFSLHGLSTPNFIHGHTSLPGISAQLSMVLATFWLWMSSLPSDHKLVEFFAKRQKQLLPIWLLVLSIFSIAVMVNPNLVTIIPLNMAPLNIIVTFMVLLLNGWTIFRYYESFRFTRFPLQISIMYSAGWMMVSQVIMVRGVLWNASWWIYHFLLIASMIVMLFGLMKQYAVKGTMVESLRSLFTNDPFERITNSLAPSVRKMVTVIEEKDSYTAGHTFRVTMYALKLAEELQLKPEQLRAIVQGGLVHDFGKINIADEILNKPGKLLPEERLLIERHPMDGFQMGRTLGLLKDELSIIRSHHERWDGKGYPDQIEGEDIPFLARIVAVADVYDALTSQRSYRKAWTHEEAMDYLIANKETHFDPICVDAWERLCKRDPSVYEIPSHNIQDDSTIHKLASFTSG